MSIAQISLGKIGDEKKLSSPNEPARTSILSGMVIILVFFVGLGTWAAIAPLSSSAQATGSFIVDSRNQTVQHLEGGIIDEILVSEGMIVEAGDLLIRLDKSRFQADVERVRAQYYSALATEARLIAERDGQDSISFPAELLDNADDELVLDIIASEESFFDSRRRQFSGQRSILRERRKQIIAEKNALDLQQEATGLQIKFINEEIKGVEALVERGLERLPRLLALQRGSAQLQGDRGEFLALMARADQRISELDLQVIDFDNRITSEVIDQLNQTQARKQDSKQLLLAARDRLSRLEIRAPRSGQIVELQYHTKGGVIQAGQPILSIVPTNDKLIIRARLSPLDIDTVRVGMSAEVALPAYSRRKVPTLPGTVTVVSADSIVIGGTNSEFFEIYVEIENSETALPDNVKLVAGMPAEVMIQTGKRTALDYIFSPITASFYRAFRED